MVTILCWEIGLTDSQQQQDILHEIQAAVPSPPHEWLGTSALFDYSSVDYQNLIQALDPVAQRHPNEFRYYVFQFLTNQFRYHPGGS